MKRRAGSGAAVLVALGAGCCTALASCGLIVGVGDYAVGDSGADGTTGGGMVDTGAEEGGGNDVRLDRADTGGQADMGGGDVDATRDAPDAMGDAPDGPTDSKGGMKADGNAADAGDAGNAGDSGVEDADGGSPEAEGGIICGQGIPTGTAFTDLVTTCVFVTSCDPYLLPVHLSDCIANVSLEASGDAGLFSCLSKIADCNGYYDCQGIRLATGLTATECSGFASSCVGNVAYDCSGGSFGGVPNPGTVTNCALIPGSSCQTYTDSNGNARADCVVVPSCTVPAGGGSQCSGNNLYTCIATNGGTTGVGYGHSCGNATCVATATSSQCSFFGTGVCGAASGATCNGGTLRQACTLPSQPFNYDCTRAGGTCATDTIGNTGCLSPGCSLSSGCTESCNGGSVITTCIGGAKYPVDCFNYGLFTTCSPTDAGSSPSWCVP
jgi:hypothetical protein